MPTLETVRNLRQSGQHEEARSLLLHLLDAAPDDAVIFYETACVHDALGYEREAVPFYERALALGLDETTQRSALLGLGSTYRALGDYQAAIATLERGLALFSDGHEFATFLAVAYYNTGAYDQAVRTLLHTLLKTTDDPNIIRYQRALHFYADRLDETW
ncbi:MAG TPA: tetratricopeptide repeat protein [Caldilineaceae bacterium]|nr:tetratricopeptide repeat protein [Caldilineaceae bacterium]